MQQGWQAGQEWASCQEKAFMAVSRTVQRATRILQPITVPWRMFFGVFASLFVSHTFHVCLTVVL